MSYEIDRPSCILYPSVFKSEYHTATCRSFQFSIYFSSFTQIIIMLHRVKKILYTHHFEKLFSSLDNFGLFDNVKKYSFNLIILDFNIYMHAFDILIEASYVQHPPPLLVLYYGYSK